MNVKLACVPVFREDLLIHVLPFVSSILYNFILLFSIYKDSINKQRKMRNVRDEIEHISNVLLFNKLTNGNILVFRGKARNTKILTRGEIMLLYFKGKYR